MFAPPKQLFDETTDFLATAPTTETLIAYPPSGTLVERLDSLLAKNESGNLTDEERTELEEFLRLNHLLKMVKLKAQLLQSSDT